MVIIDLTAEFKDPAKSWTTGGRRLLEQFTSATQGIKVGLYGSLYRNDAATAVLDANARPDERGERHGKVIIKARGRTLKSGKFETRSGVIGRHKQNHDHQHRRGSPERVCRECLQCFFVLDLTRRLPDGTRLGTCETPWKRGVKAYLRARQWDDPAQNGRSESRFLRDGAHPTPDELRALLEQLETQLVRQMLILP